MPLRPEPRVGSEAQPTASWVPRTKLLPVRNEDDVVLDGALVDEVRQATHARTLTLVRAQGGSGKTALAAAVVAEETDRIVTWIGLDASDDATSLLHMLAASLSPELPGGCPAFAAVLGGDLPASYDARRSIGALVNDLLAVGAPPTLLVLDDLHAVTDPDAHDAVRYLLERAPDDLHVLATARSAPPVGLARLRASRRVAEFTDEHLRLSPRRARELLNDRLGLGLDGRQIDALVHATGGWVTGIRLLAGRGLPTEEREPQDLYDYFVEEILTHEPAEARDVLLATCVLDVVTPPLAAELSGRTNAGDLLDGIHHRIPFLVLRAGTAGYHYHDLFGAFLRSVVERREVGGVARLHARTATALAGSPAEVEHLIAAGHDQAAADAIEGGLSRGVPSGLDLTRAAARIEALDPAVWQDRPWLALVVGVGALMRGDRQRAVPLLERAFAAFADGDDEFGHWIAARHLHHASFDAERFVPVFRQIEASPGFDTLPVPARVEHHMSSVYGAIAVDEWEEAGRRVGLAVDTARASNLREAADVLAVHLSPLVATAPEALSRIAACADWLAADFGDHPLLRLGSGNQRATAAFLRGDPWTAAEAAAAVDELPERLGGLPYQRNTLDWLLATAALVKGDLEAAWRRAGGNDPDSVESPLDWPRLAFLARLERRRHGAPSVFAARFQGRDRHATAWTDHARLTEFSLNAQVEWARGDLGAAERSLREGLALQDRIRLLPFVPDLRLDLALLLLAAGRHREARETMADVLSRVERLEAPGLALIAGDEALPLLRLIRGAGPHRALVERLIDILDSDRRPDPVRVAETGETLSSREVEVLRLIAAGATNPEIAQSLVISPNTVKTHVRKVLAKVGAANRAQAVVAARRLGVG